MIRALFNRPFATREEIDYTRAATATPKFCFTASCVGARNSEYRSQTQSAYQRVLENYVREIKRLGYGQWSAIEASRVRHSFHSGFNPDDEMKYAA